jgi:hypothetical protein
MEPFVSSARALSASVLEVTFPQSYDPELGILDIRRDGAAKGRLAVDRGR